MFKTQLITDWICIAMEGLTLDRRIIERQWLIDSAELYDPQLCMALIWPEHEDYGFNLGEVIEVKAEEGEDKLMRLYVRICPAAALIDKNRNGQLIFGSPEFTKDGNFRGTGKTYLEGLGVTNTPAGAGVDRMRFSKKQGRRLGDWRPLTITEVKEFKRGNQVSAKNKNGWRSLFSLESEPTEPSEPSDTERLEALAQALADFDARLIVLEGKFTSTIETVEGLEGDLEVVKSVVDTEEFSRLRTELPNVLKKFSKLDVAVTRVPSKVPGQTQPAKTAFKFL